MDKKEEERRRIPEELNLLYITSNSRFSALNLKGKKIQFVSPSQALFLPTSPPHSSDYDFKGKI